MTNDVSEFQIRLRSLDDALTNRQEARDYLVEQKAKVDSEIQRLGKAQSSLTEAQHRVDNAHEALQRYMGVSGNATDPQPFERDHS